MLENERERRRRGQRTSRAMDSRGRQERERDVRAAGGETPWLPLSPGMQIADLNSPVLKRARAAFDEVWSSHVQIVKDSTDVYERHTLSVQYEERLAKACQEATAHMDTQFEDPEVESPISTPGRHVSFCRNMYIYE